MKSNNTKYIWDLINSVGVQKQEKSAQISVQIFMGHLKTLSNVSTETLDDTFLNRSTINHSTNEELNKCFTAEELMFIARKLKSKKACGFDHIRTELLKHSSSVLFAFMTDMFHQILECCIIPTKWCIGMIVPLYKNKGDINDPDNYRDITLLSCMGKFFTACLNYRITNYVEKAGIIGIVLARN